MASTLYVFNVWKLPFWIFPKFLTGLWSICSKTGLLLVALRCGWKNKTRLHNVRCILTSVNSMNRNATFWNSKHGFFTPSWTHQLTWKLIALGSSWKIVNPILKTRGLPEKGSTYREADRNFQESGGKTQMVDFIPFTNAVTFTFTFHFHFKYQANSHCHFRQGEGRG